MSNSKFDRSGIDGKGCLMEGLFRSCRPKYLLCLSNSLQRIISVGCEVLHQNLYQLL
ncbi:hypothetical protein LINPERPRIM_LOCUS40796 [Linum perenne]